MHRIVRAKRRLLAGAAALATTATLAVAVVPTARADGGILGDVSAVTSYVGFVQQAYNLFNQYVLGQKQPSQLDQIQAAITQSQTQIENQMALLASAGVKQCADDAVEGLERINTDTVDTLQAFVTASEDCVNEAAADINAEPSTAGAAIDNAGFALNIVGPIALFAAADANQPTDILTQDLIIANQRLMARLAPTCAPSILTPADLPSFGEGPVTGHGACYNYHVATPAPVDNFVTYIPGGPDMAFLPWHIRGDAGPIDDLIPSRGYVVAWPQVTDYSIAVKQVMADTSYPIANGALYQLQNPVTATGSPIAAAVPTGSLQPAHVIPEELVRANGDGTVSRNEVHPVDDTLSGWTAMDGTLLRSVAEESNADGRMEMFGLDKLGNVFHRWQEETNNDASWSPWAQLAGQQLTSISVARNQDGTLQVFGTTPAGQVVTSNQVMGGDYYVTVEPNIQTSATDTWTAWKQLSGQSLTQVAAHLDGAGQIELFGLDAAGHVFHIEQTAPNAADPSVAGNWSAWDQQGGTLTSLAVTSDLGGSLNLFGTDSSGAVLQNFGAGWVAVPGMTAGHVAAAMETGGGGHIDLFAANASGQIFLATNDGLHGDSWSAWSPVPDTPAAPVALTTVDQGSTLGLQVSMGLSASGGTGPYSFAVSGLPPGMSSAGPRSTGPPRRRAPSPRR